MDKSESGVLPLERGNWCDPKDDEIRFLSCFRVLPWWIRLDLVPFLLLYVVSISLVVVGDLSAPAVLVVFIVHAFVLLCVRWFVSVRSWLCFRRMGVIPSTATHVRVFPHEHAGLAEIRKVHHRWDQEGVLSKSVLTFFYYQRRRYKFDSDRGVFLPPQWPNEKLLPDYVSSREALRDGLNPPVIVRAQDEFGTNRLSIPAPNFANLFIQQATAPFFVFQVFCVLLWSLDGYASYSLVTLGMLVMFEANVVRSRMKNLKMIRAMAPSPTKVRVRRGGRWVLRPSVDVVPGDLVVISSDLAVDIEKKEENKQDKMKNESKKRDEVKKQPRAEHPAWPCDTLVLWGSVVANEALLTGESVPQRKDAVSEIPSESVADWERTRLSVDRDHRDFVVFSGTEVLLTASGSKSDDSKFSSFSELDRGGQAVCPDGCAVGLVLRTGLGTSQGSLIRSIVYGPERYASANTLESLFFILILLLFGIASAVVVVLHGMKDPTMSAWRLLLEAALIITSVVPPELPMELSMAVNASIAELSKLKIYCTEPFRIPLAGKTDICCFDKTGTITSDELYLRGVVLPSPRSSPDSPVEILSPGPTVPEVVQSAVGGCHSLVVVNGQIVGDPIEAAALSALHFSVSSAESTVQGQGPAGVATGRQVRQVCRHRFSAVLRRMSTVVSRDHLRGSPYLVAVKGAPESLRELFVEVPEDFDMVNRELGASGARILALATKELPAEMPVSAIRNLARADLESDLTFAGFLVFDSSLKEGSAESLRDLLDSGHDLKIITGDALLTACAIAQKCGFAERTETSGLLCWRSFVRVDRTPAVLVDGIWKSLHGETVCALHERPTKSLSREHMLCVEGSSLPLLSLDDFESISVYARTTPDQKGTVVSKLKEKNTVLMCGDGTNDVGALRRADVGVAIVSAAVDEAQDKADKEREARAKDAKAQVKKRRRLGWKARMEMARRDLERAQQEEEGELVQLGDASIAAPFTAKRSSLSSVPNIVRRGRCTLVITVEMFKILALNCLVGAYSMSVLFLDGVKMGDGQATFASLLIAGCFLFIAKAQPSARLSSLRPVASVFNIGPLLSTIGQCITHFATLIIALRIARASEGTAPIWASLSEELERKFHPSLVNTVVFLIGLGMQIVTFLVNYRGRPFMVSLSENKELRGSLLLSGAGTAVLTLGIIPPLNSFLQLVPLSLSLRLILVGLMIANLFVSLGVEFTTRFLFESEPSEPTSSSGTGADAPERPDKQERRHGPPLRNEMDRPRERKSPMPRKVRRGRK